eukprot:5814010-Prymnesium_polylepis.1
MYCETAYSTPRTHAARGAMSSRLVAEVTGAERSSAAVRSIADPWVMIASNEARSFTPRAHV